ncbi:MAG TPA: hypothetical protein VEI97_17160 [bacterium]|nr:hypothetical protein [bacterium]
MSPRHRVPLALVGLLALVLLAAVLPRPAVAPESPPPAAPTAPADSTTPLDALEAQLGDGTLTPSDVLADPAWMDHHFDRRFRALMRDHAPVGAITMVTPEEPGPPLVIDGRLVDPVGNPIAGALVYAYHTDQTGLYGNEGSGFDPTQHNRLFGYVRTGSEGAFQLTTVRPASYPSGTNPQHVHLDFQADGYAQQHTEIEFADDPLMTPAIRRDVEAHGGVVTETPADENGVQRGSATFTLVPLAR